MFRRLRIVVLLLLLLFLGIGTLLDRFYTLRWTAPLVVAVYPINADGSIVTERYIGELQASDFTPIEDFFASEAKAFNLAVERPFQITLAPAMKELPPKPPVGAGPLTIAAWSLHLRWWAWLTPPKPSGPTPRIRLFLLYYDPATHTVLEHSTGITKGRLGIVNVFATQQAAGSNAVIIAHELLHTLGATDKYDPETTLPLYPDGYAEPEALPRLPQRFAELMGGRIPLSTTQAVIPDSLDQVLIGSKTALEIGWIRN